MLHRKCHVWKHAIQKESKHISNTLMLQSKIQLENVRMHVYITSVPYTAHTLNSNKNELIKCDFCPLTSVPSARHHDIESLTPLL